jgi:hypothetical protein
MTTFAVCTTGKVRYKTGPEALKKSKEHSKEYNNTMTPYSCPVCCGWHLRSHKEPINAARIYKIGGFRV